MDTIAKTVREITDIEAFKAVYWATKPNNKYSQKLAEKYGWKVVRNDETWKTYAKSITKDMM